jgi:hypothetical protein
VILEDATIPWNFPPPEGMSGSFCRDIPEGININPDDLGSDRVKRVINKEMPDGKRRIEIFDRIRGTASDQNGTTYRFLYINNSSYDFDGRKVKARMVDYFSLKGGEVNYTLGFRWRWAYRTRSLEIVEIKDPNGNTVDITVDPMFFPTDDGVNESPNIIRGSWVILFNQGDFWNCDPL